MLHTFNITPSSLHLLSSTPAGVDPCHVSASATLIATSNYSSGTVALHSTSSPPNLLHTLDLNPLYSTLSVPSNLHDRQESSHCHQSTFTPDNRHLLVCDLGSSAVVTFDLSQSPPSLASTCRFPANSGCRHLTLIGEDCYVMLELVSAVSHCKLDLETGGLTEVAVLPLLPEGELGETRAHHRGGGGIVASPSGEFIYATLRNTVPGVVVALKRDIETGDISVHKRGTSGGEIPRCLVCVGDEYVMVSNQEDRKVCCLKGDGDLTLLAEVGGFNCSVAFVGELR
ncbi:hypothetical protein TrRE_jg7444 [Triparma retinervis]|uniref:Uncharacterized protein n=1 Tax=Triparma retinervis TaxID=2557542 RepID=A0A9W7FC86_9STRA|nr:hypothetical protein TrRE_jg7444 [Triparma retinervis]